MNLKERQEVYNKMWGKLKGPSRERALEEIMRQYMKNVHDQHPPRPVGKANYVGIEIECFSDLEETEVMELILKHNLEKHVNIGEDGSIEEDFGQAYELRILSKESELSSVLKKLAKIFKEGKFGVNGSCGLHIHLDMRNRNFKECYDKLLKFQHIMFGLVKSERWTSEFCEWNNDDKPGSRFKAVNEQSYSEHKTIEIRLHHGTLNVGRIENWIKLLLKAIKRKEIKRIESKEEVIKWAGANKKLKQYIGKNFNKSWLKSRDLIIAGGHSEDPDDHYDMWR
jgi:hypothetical protein